MKAGWKIALAVLISAAGLPLVASAGHGHHRGGGYGYGGYGGACGCGAAVQYAPPPGAQYGQPTPAAGGQVGGDYQSFSYSPTPAGELDAAAAPPPVMNGPAYYPPAAPYGSGYYGGGYSGNSWGARVYNNAANKTLGRHDYGRGR